MRVSSNQIFNIATVSIADANEAVVKTQTQLSTGKRVLNPSDDPVASSNILSIKKELADIEQFQRNIDSATNSLVFQESALKGVTNIILRIQELAIQAGNTATLSENEYDALAREVDLRLSELEDLLNSQNVNGDYIFGGFKSTRAPFSGDVLSGFQYAGDDGQQFIKVANNTSVAATDSGKEIFVDIRSTNNTVITKSSPVNRSDPAASISIGQVVDQDVYDSFYPEDIIITFNEDTDIIPPGKNFTARERSTGRTIVANQLYSQGNEITIQGVSFSIFGNPVSGTAAQKGDQFIIESTEKQDILTTLARFSQSMKSYDGTDQARDILGKVIASTIENLSNSQTSISETVSSLGTRLNTLESTKQLHLDTELISRQLLSSLQDVDYSEAATRLSAQSLILEAAQATFVRISRLTLFSQF